MRLNNADALLELYDREHIGAPGGARKLITDAPAIEGRPTARWIEESDGWDGSYWTCSVCGESMEFTDGEGPEENGFKYCPYCGAKMEALAKAE